jgi:hypothetical protein
VQAEFWPVGAPQPILQLEGQDGPAEHDHRPDGGAGGFGGGAGGYGGGAGGYRGNVQLVVSVGIRFLSSSSFPSSSNYSFFCRTSGPAPGRTRGR